MTGRRTDTMEVRDLHSWHLTPSQAVELQRSLAPNVDVRRPLRAWDLVAAADVSCQKFDPRLYASVVVWSAATQRVVESADVVTRARFPYVPGLLSFREAPGILEAFRQIRARPDVLLVDGHGFAHPRRFGLACHLGLWLDLPTIGCAKTRLCGTHRMPRTSRGSLAPLRVGDDPVGYVVRTRQGVRPVFVSSGHRIDLASAVRVVLACCQGYRLPEPSRLAHQRVNELRRKSLGRGED